MKTKVILAGLLACIGITAQAQDTKTEEPKGKAIVQVFGNFHTGFGAENDDRGFELERSYFGYEYNFGNGLSAKAVMDIGKSSSVDDYQRIAYIKNAMVSWKKGGLTLNGGLISTTQFNFQEKFWGYRYIMKSFQDEYKFGSSADLGISVAYKFADWLSADAIIVNGEGYKKIQVNDGLNYGLGVTLTPVKGFQIRLYGGLNESGEEGKRILPILRHLWDISTINSLLVRNIIKCGMHRIRMMPTSMVTRYLLRLRSLSSQNYMLALTISTQTTIGTSQKMRQRQFSVHNSNSASM